MASIHRVIFGFWRILSICSIVVFKTLDSADNKCTFCKSLYCSYYLYKITSWNLFVFTDVQSSDAMRVISGMKLCYTLTTCLPATLIYQFVGQCWSNLFMQICLEALLEALLRQYTESTGKTCIMVTSVVCTVQSLENDSETNGSQPPKSELNSVGLYRRRGFATLTGKYEVTKLS